MHIVDVATRNTVNMRSTKYVKGQLANLPVSVASFITTMAAIEVTCLNFGHIIYPLKTQSRHYPNSVVTHSSTAGCLNNLLLTTYGAANDGKVDIMTTLVFQCLSRPWRQIWRNGQCLFSVSNQFHLQTMWSGHGPVSGQNWSTTKKRAVGIEPKHPRPVIQPGFVSTYDTADGWHRGRTATQKVCWTKTRTKKSEKWRDIGMAI